MTTQEPLVTVRNARTEKRFFPTPETTIVSIRPRPNCWYIHVDQVLVGGYQPVEMLALFDNAGNLVQWEEIQEIVQAVQPFYDKVPLFEIRQFNARSRIEIRGLERTAKSPRRDGFVYLLQSGPYYKIGASTDVKARVAQLSTQPPFEIELLHSIPADDMYALEKDLHERYADRRKRGEWFELEPDDVEHIKGL